MKKICYVSLILVLVLGVVPSGHAEFYKFKNNQGVVVFTDDLAKVPENQREEAFQYEDSPSQDVSHDQNEVVSGDLAESSSLEEVANSDDQLNTMNSEDPGEGENQEISEEWNDVVSSGEEGDMEAETET
ncbi:MAG: DUF4124 domain-containing protein [Proteobacteria bacterium]|nr:DUF4124 domain-containing protein [Pseudomonadota bacterium]